MQSNFACSADGPQRICHMSASRQADRQHTEKESASERAREGQSEVDTQREQSDNYLDSSVWDRQTFH